MNKTFEFAERFGIDSPITESRPKFPQFPMPFDFTTLNVSQLANKYYGNNAVIEKKGLKVYADEDSKDLFNNNEIETLEEVIVYSNRSYMEFEDFDLSLFSSTNGVTLLQQFKEVEVSSNEIAVFLEIDNPTNFFGTVMRIKVGSNLEGKKDLPYSDIIEFAKGKDISISPSRIKRLLKKGIKSKKNLFKWVLSSIAKTIGKAVEFLSGEVGDLFYKTIPDAIDSIRISETSWNPNKEDYNAIFIPDKFENYVAKLKDNNKDENDILKAFVKPFFNQLKKLESYSKGELKVIKGFVPNKVYRKIKNTVDYIFEKINGIEALIYNPEYGLLKLILTALEAANAFICGLYNSIIDTLKGIFQIIGLVFKGVEVAADFASNLGYYASLSIEFIENIVEGILEIDFIELFKQLFFLPLVTMQKVVTLALNQTALTIQELYYYIGYIVGFIVETVISILFTGGSLSIGKVLAKTFKEPVELLLKGFKGIVSASKSLINKVISAVQHIIKKLKNPKQLAADFIKFIEDLFGAGKKLSKFGKITKALMKLEMPDEFLNALKKLGMQEDDILEYFTKYHNENNYRFLNEINELLIKYPNLTKADAFSLWSYTTNCYYWNLNDWLRRGINVTKTKEISKMITKALEKMPKYNGNAFRALEFNDEKLLLDFLTKHRKGKTVKYNDFVSCGSNTEAAFFNKPKKNVRLKMTVKDAPVVSDFADGIKFRGYVKDELLLLRGRKFIVKEYKEVNGIHYFELIENKIL